MHDSCGYITSQSNHHKTMHLTLNQGSGGTWNLIWNGYEGFEYNTFHIYRGTSKNNLIKIAEQDSKTFIYSDLSPPSGTVYYQIEVVIPNLCRINNLKSTNDNFSVTRSNMVTNEVIGINNISFDGIEIYPNPTTDFLTIETTITDQYKIQIINLSGQMIFSSEIEKTTHKLDLSSFQKGVYIISVRSKDLIITRKIIKL